jgi:LacI family transcriptional regulator
MKIPKIILLVEHSRAFGRSILYGIAKYSRLHGPWAFYRHPPYYMEPWGPRKTLSWLKNIIRKFDADGVIMRAARNVEALVETGLPTIVLDINEPIPNLANIICSNVEIGKLGAEYLLNRGFRYFAYCGFDDMRWSIDRGKGFCDRVSQAGFETSVYVQPKSKTNRSWEKEQSFVVDWLRSLPKPVALMVCNDDRGQYVTEACKIAGLHVPEELAIIGVDNDELICDLTDPPLSSVAVNTEMAGFEAAKLMKELMDGEDMAGKVIMVNPTHVVTRKSTDILAIEDREVAEAVRFIRRNAKRSLQVNEVAQAAALSRRVLEKRFRAILHRSVHQEIKRIRITLLTEMLTQTDMTISEIASEMGFPGAEHIARYFRKEKGMSLIDYRKKYVHKYK